MVSAGRFPEARREKGLFQRKRGFCKGSGGMPSGASIQRYLLRAFSRSRFKGLKRSEPKRKSFLKILGLREKEKLRPLQTLERKELCQAGIFLQASTYWGKNRTWILKTLEGRDHELPYQRRPLCRKRGRPVPLFRTCLRGRNEKEGVWKTQRKKN